MKRKAKRLLPQGATLINPRKAEETRDRSLATEFITTFHTTSANARPNNRRIQEHHKAGEKREQENASKHRTKKLNNTAVTKDETHARI